jgi:hypothetical protein
MILGHIIDAAIGLFLGGYLLLAASGKVGVSKKPEESAKWRDKYGTLAGVCGFVVFLGGAYHVVRIFF